MRKRLILVTLAAAVIACVGLITLAMMPPRHGVTKADLNRLHKGMTPEEVEAILGEADIDSIGKHGKGAIWYGRRRRNGMVRKYCSVLWFWLGRCRHVLATPRAKNHEIPRCNGRYHGSVW
jgi:hypothetical protein